MSSWGSMKGNIGGSLSNTATYGSGDGFGVAPAGSIPWYQADEGGTEFASAYNQSAQSNYGSGSSGMLQQGSAMFASGMTDLVSSMIGGKKRRAEQQEANKEFQQTKMAYAMHDTSNPYANLQNTYEDLTINQQHAQFLAQQQQQGLANTMGSLKGAAGGSGIAALAQAMANQQSVNLQKSAASIGMQESRNQQLAAKGAMGVQTMERKGEVMSRQMELEKITTMFGMAQQRKAAADEAREKATRGAISGTMESIVGGGLIVGGVMGQVGGMGG